MRAQDDEGDDDLADVEGESEGEETAILDDGVETDDSKDDGRSGGSPDAATTVLFTKPVVVPGTNLGNVDIFYISLLHLCCRSGIKGLYPVSCLSINYCLAKYLNAQNML